MTTKKFSNSLFIFRRDLRLIDNRGLLAACRDSETVHLCFIFNPAQTQPHSYQSMPALQFMLESLQELSEEAQKISACLSFFYGSPEEVLDKLLSKQKFDAVYFNRDFTPFARARDAGIKKTCEAKCCSVFQYGDSLLFEPEELLKADKTPYTIYTPFSKRAFALDIKLPISELPKNISSKLLPDASKAIPGLVSATACRSPAAAGGRSHALNIIASFPQICDYETQRNLPALNATTKLSAHNKFGTVSAREVFAAVTKTLQRDHTLNKELLWRDFFTHIAFHFPKVFSGSFYSKYDAITWDDDQVKFLRWCNGETGFPIVDAGMRELNQTGYLHNRVRMIVASFLTKDLHISWQWGEKYFAQKLIDYDPSVNNGNWQWASSSGCDASPYFRIFNPWLQQQKFDPETLYIKRWIPELSGFSSKRIHEISEQGSPTTNYPAPLIDHATEKKETERRYRIALKGD